jgi:hypothetical protein
MKLIDNINTLTMIHEECNKNYNDYDDDDYYLGIYGGTRRLINEKITSLKRIRLHALSSELKFNLYKSIQ